VAFSRAFSGRLPGIDPARARAALSALMAGQPAALPGVQPAFLGAFHDVLLISAACAVLAGVVGGLTIGRRKV
jgi:hypothetical protein